MKKPSETKPEAALFVTCLVDLMRPEVGFAAASLIEAAGFEVVVPRWQTCCGQPNYNSGDTRAARSMAARTIEVLEEYKHVVVPSGSCAGMIKVHYPRLFDAADALFGKAKALADKTEELTVFLARHGYRPAVPLEATRVAYHDSCSGLRELGISAQPRALLRRIPALKVLELAEPEVCCGFGGTFCVKYPDISGRMAANKTADIAATGADTVAMGDVGCLLNIEGRLRREGSGVRACHVAELLAGTLEPPPWKVTAVEVESGAFVEKARAALDDAVLQHALKHIKHGFVEARAAAAARLPDFEAMRDRARDVKAHTIAHLADYLEQFEANVTALGGHVHWARDAAQAREIILGICRDKGARTVTKSKSMVTEEIELNPYLEAGGVEPIETDLGEYIIQLRKEKPSHIIAPVIHLSKDQVADTFHEHHPKYGFHERLTVRADMVREARSILRERFVKADVGITGANFLVAETGSTVVVTNEGNADLTASLPDTHIVVTGIEKLVPTLEDCHLMLRLLPRSATGQDVTAYMSFFTGPKRPGDLSGPSSFHVVLLDNGRSGMMGTEFEEMLRCIRCGACLNHCPVYANIGGHAYGSVYPGPMGAVLTPSLVGIDKAGHLPNASSFCGRCEAVCPVRIPLPRMMRHWREREFERHLTPKGTRWGLHAWAVIAASPRVYRAMQWTSSRLLRLLAWRGWIRRLPLAGSGWTSQRDMRAPRADSFQRQWRKRGGRR